MSDGKTPYGHVFVLVEGVFTLGTVPHTSNAVLLEPGVGADLVKL